MKKLIYMLVTLKKNYTKNRLNHLKISISTLNIAPYYHLQNVVSVNLWRTLWTPQIWTSLGSVLDRTSTRGRDVVIGPRMRHSTYQWFNQKSTSLRRKYSSAPASQSSLGFPLKRKALQCYRKPLFYVFFPGLIKELSNVITSHTSLPMAHR